MPVREKVVELVRELDRLTAERDRLNMEIQATEKRLDDLLPEQRSLIAFVPVPTPPKSADGLTSAILRVLAEAHRPLPVAEILKRVPPTTPKSFRATIYRLKREKRIRSAGRGMYRAVNTEEAR